MKVLGRLWPLGIHLQLMLWYSVVFASLMGLSGILFYLRFQTTLAGSMDTALQLQAQQVAGDITEERGVLSIQDATADLPGFDTCSTGKVFPFEPLQLFGPCWFRLKASPNLFMAFPGREPLRPSMDNRCGSTVEP